MTEANQRPERQRRPWLIGNRAPKIAEPTVFMKKSFPYLSAFLALTGLFTYAADPVDHVTADKGTVFEYLQMQNILETTAYPVRRGDLVKRLGGKKRLRQYASLSQNRNGVRMHTIDYALSDNASEIGFYLIEFVLAEEPKSDGSDKVLSAQYYFQSGFGERFVPEKPGVKRANQSEPTTTAVTPPAAQESRTSRAPTITTSAVENAN